MSHVPIVEDSGVTTPELLTDRDSCQHGDLEMESIFEKTSMDLSKGSQIRTVYVAAVLHCWPE